jgi:hypothetical protein
MYYELGYFLRRIITQKPFWKDGDLWTAVISGVLSYVWFLYDPSSMDKIRQHFRDLLSAISIIFGFSLTGLLFYIQTSSSWQKEVARIADKIVDRHVWTIICLLFLIGYVIVLWSIGIYIDHRCILGRSLYSVLTLSVVYSGCQILNHSLTIWWFFRKRDDLKAFASGVDHE